MKKHLRYIILLCLLLHSLLSVAQDNSSTIIATDQKLKKSITDYYKRYPQEKIYLHSDQSVYFSGQTIWYKAYSLTYGKPSQLSKIVYVCLTDSLGKQIKQDKLPLKNGVAHGDIILPNKLHTGLYQLQIYTAWMLNFEEYCFYRQKIFVQNISDTIIQNSILSKPKTYHISFFTEGGDLIDGSVCNIAFKATDENGLPVPVSGNLLIDNKKTTTAFTTLHDGMGSFELEAYSNQNYKVQVHFPDNSVQTITLPSVKKEGISLRVSSVSAGKIAVRIAFAGKQLSQDVVIAAMQTNGLSATYPVRLSRGTNLINLDKNNFATGILRLTIFNDAGIPQAERIVFINNNDQLKLALVEDTLSFYPKAKNTFTLNLKDQENNPVKGNLSVSVTDANIEIDSAENILSSFLINSELKGNVYHPSTYFKNNSDSLQKQLDLVMLTNGWRHFKWEKILNGQPRELKYAPERLQFVVGKIENYQEKDNLKLKLTVINADSTVNYFNLNPDSSGRFIINDYEKQGTAKVIVEAFNQKNKSRPVKVSFASSVIDTVNFDADSLNKSNPIKPVIRKTFLDSLNAEQRSQLMAKGIVLKAVTVKTQKITAEQDVINRHVKHFTTEDAYNLDIVHNKSLPTMDIFSYMQGKFPGLQISIQPPDKVYFTYHGVTSLVSVNGGDLPYFYIDENRADLETIKALPFIEVALIRFVPPPVWFAPLNGGSNGAILIYTKNYEDEKVIPAPAHKLNQYNFNGYSIIREFSEPDYKYPQQRNKPDFRTTLFWNHDLNTDKEGNVKINFYNSDKAKRFRVIVQGMDAEGRMCYLNEEVYAKGL